MATSIEAIVKQLLIKEPFYGIFLLGMNRHFGTMCETACVYRDGINISLCINEEFWNSLESDDMRADILRHECGHILNKHFFMQEFFGNAIHFNVASDAEVNSYLPLLQRDPYVYAAKFGLSDKLGTKVYYERIPMDNEFENNTDGEGIPNNGLVDDHSTWKDLRELPDAERELIDHQIDYKVKEAAEQTQKMCGSIPGQFKDYIDSLFKQKPPIFNWKSYFRRMLGSIIDISLRKTRKKDSLRFPDCAGIKYKKKTHIMVAIDTSGSVSNEELCDFFSEINNIYKAGAAITIVEFDHALQKQYEYTGKWDGSIHGRGGTSFEEPVELYNSVRKDYQSLIMFTDGYADIDRIKPQGQVIWIITSDGSRQNYPGKVVYIPKNEQ